MPRKKHLDPPVERVFSIPQSVVAQVELLIMDSARGKPKYGAWSALVTQLLRGWLEEQINNTEESYDERNVS